MRYVLDRVRVEADGAVVEALVVPFCIHPVLYVQLFGLVEKFLSATAVINSDPCVPSVLVAFKSKLPPETERREPGVEEPMPTFPFARIVKSDEVANVDEVVDATSNSLPVFPNDDWIESLADGVEVPITTFPEEVMRICSIEFVINHNAPLL